MAKLTLLALALAALVAFATAHTTIVTTTINDEYPLSDRRQCSQRLQGQRLNQCRMFLQQQGQIPYNWGRQQQQHPQQQHQQEMLEQCCQQLQNVEEQCQCEAVKQVFREAQQERQQRGQIVPFLGSQQTQQLKQKAQALPNLCNLQSQQCQIGTIGVTFTESNSDSEMRRPFGSRSQQCRESEIQRPVSQCQRYVEQQMQAYQQQQQPGRRRQQHQQGPYGSQQTQRLRQKAEILPNVCNLQSRQCRVGTIITTVTESNIDVDRPFGSRSQQCRESEIQRPVNQCQRYVEQQMQAYQQQQQPGRRQQQRPEGLEECCNELQNVERECQCQAVEEVARRVIRQPQQQQQRQRQQQQQQGEQQQMDIARRVIQNLPNQCNLEVRQCSNIPYGMI